MFRSPDFNSDLGTNSTGTTASQELSCPTYIRFFFLYIYVMAKKETDLFNVNTEDSFMHGILQ